jgi:hypothetical protein
MPSVILPQKPKELKDYLGRRKGEIESKQGLGWGGKDLIQMLFRSAAKP